MRKAPDGHTPDPEAVEIEIQRINAAIDVFAAQMKEVMTRKAREGRTGWDDPGLREAIVMGRMAHAINAGHAPAQAIHAANFSMMLFAIDHALQPA